MALVEKFNEEDLFEGKRNKRGAFICQRKWCWDESMELQKHSMSGWRKERCNVSPVRITRADGLARKQNRR